MNELRILILGANGMLGHKLFQHLSTRQEFQVFGSVRNLNTITGIIPDNCWKATIPCADANHFESIHRIISRIKPDIVINCIGIIKHVEMGQDRKNNILINSLLPHRLAEACGEADARLLHISTDCVFSGKKGNYSEDDTSDAEDIYGRCKFLGEVDYPHCLTLRTSIIGHEINSRWGLLEWFLAQNDSVQGYTRHIYTGFPTIVLAYLLADYILTHRKLNGVYHLSSEPISKYDLLKLIADKYKKSIEVIPYEGTSCDRSLNSAKLREAVNFSCPSWPEMITHMYEDFINTRYPVK